MPLVRSLTLPTLKRRRRPRPHAHSSATSVVAEVPRESYRWAVEIEIEFVERRLGVRLREVLPAPSSAGSDDSDAGECAAPFFAEVDALPKPSRAGKRAGAAELYNWSVPAARRLAVGMRLTGIGDAHVAGWTYGQVVRALQLAGRPVRLRFADVSKGTRSGSEGDASDGSAVAGDDLLELEAERGGPRMAQLCRRREQELARELVARELHVERWRLERRRTERARALAAAKSLVLSHAVDALRSNQRELRAADEALARERSQLERVLGELQAQAAPGAVRPEVERARWLEERQALLVRDIARLEAGNQRLQRERSARRRSLEDAERELRRVEGELETQGDRAGSRRLRQPSPQIDGQGDDDLEDEEEDDDGSEWLGDDLEALRRRARALEEELAAEQRKLEKARRERQQMRARDERLTARANGEVML